MAPNVGSFFNKFLSLLLLVIHIGCFVFTTTSADNRRRQQYPPIKKRKVTSQTSPVHSSLKPAHKALSSSWSFLKRIFSASKTHRTTPHTIPSTPARSSQLDVVSVVPSPQLHLSDPPRKLTSGFCPDSDITSEHKLFPLRNDIFPCTACGEIFQKPQLLEQHQFTKHAVSELIDGDTGKNIVRIIFKTGWTENERSPKICRILKIHNSPKILSRFEEYREFVKEKAARHVVSRRRDERCVADGNELLRFHCSTFLCNLGLDGNSSICNQQFCNICGIIKSGFSPKLDGISTLSTSWRAHVAIPEEMEEEFKFLNVKRAMLVCRVVAGRVGCDADDVDKEDSGFDSVVGRNGSGTNVRVDEDELLVFNPRAVLPCFVIVYNV